MTTLPTEDDFTNAARTVGDQKQNFADLRNYLAGLFGTAGAVMTGTAVMQTTTDTTAGRALVNGGYGIGGPGILQNDCNGATAPGAIYRVNLGAATNAPTWMATGWASLRTYQHDDASNLTQEIAGDGNVAFRQMVAGAWGDWVPVTPYAGTYTVELTDAQSPANVSATTGTGYYHRWGSLCRVTITAAITNIDTSGMTGADELRWRLPFAASPSGRGLGNVGFATMATSYISAQAEIAGNNDYAIFTVRGGMGGGSVMQVQDLYDDATDVWHFDAIYEVA